MMFGGVDPRLPEMSGFHKFITYLSQQRWALEALTVAEFRALPESVRNQAQIAESNLDDMGYYLDAEPRCLLFLFILGLVYRLIAFILLWLERQIPGGLGGGIKLLCRRIVAPRDARTREEVADAISSFDAPGS